jgi:hypothetical protein
MSTSSLADPLYERLRRSFPADQAYTSADWNADTMPSPVRHYLSHLLHHHGRQEAARMHHARTDWVNYDHPEVEQAARTFLDTIDDHTRVPQDQWAETLRTATRRTTDYLVRPVPTLKAFVFKESSGAVSISQIQWRMQFFGPYAYLRDAVQAFAKKHDRETLEPDPFEQVLRRVDERMTADYEADRWLRLLDPLFETAQRATGRRQVPLPLLHTFFEEKNAAPIVDRLPPHEHGTEADAAAPDTLRRLIGAASTEASPDRHDAPGSPLDPDLQDPREARHAEDAEAPSSDENADETAPMWKRFEQDLSRRSGATDAETGDEAQPLWAQFQERTSPSAPDADSPSSPSAPTSHAASEEASLPSDDDELSVLEREVFGATNPPNRTVYVQELFGGDEEAYRQILKRLRKTGSWSTASQIIASDVFRAHQVNIYSDAAVHFTNAVEAAFKEA